MRIFSPSFAAGTNFLELIFNYIFNFYIVEQATACSGRGFCNFFSNISFEGGLFTSRILIWIIIAAFCREALQSMMIYVEYEENKAIQSITGFNEKKPIIDINSPKTLHVLHHSSSARFFY